MRLAVIGSRTINKADISLYVDESVTEIVSGGAVGVDSCAKYWAQKNNIPLTEIQLMANMLR